VLSAYIRVVALRPLGQPVEVGSGSVARVEREPHPQVRPLCVRRRYRLSGDRNKRLKSRRRGETESRDHEGKIKAPVPVPGNSAPEKGKG
jgi:hypothetical protein